MKLLLNFSREQHIGDLVKEFAKAFPYLRLSFYDQQDPKKDKLLQNSLLLEAAGLKQEATMDVRDDMTVGAFEKAVKDRFGLIVQVFRKSGDIWLETTMTDTWTLKQQNEHGREFNEKLSTDDSPIDFDLGRGDL